MIIKSIIKPNTYIDSMSLMALSTKVNQLPLVKKAMIGMGTDMNKQVINDVGLMDQSIESAGRSDLIIVFQVEKESDIDTVIAEITQLQNSKQSDDTTHKSFSSLSKAIKSDEMSNLALFSIPGEYVYQEAKLALDNDKNVMIFSDNISVEEEISLKKIAIEKDLLLMGPDCGTAIINGAGLCFANKVTRGDIGIVAASGTGSQEVSVQIDRLGSGVSQLIGVGGRDLSEDVGGIMMLHAMKMLENDPQTKVITLISKPPAKIVEQKIIEVAQKIKKPIVICFIGTKDASQTGNVTIVPNTLLAAKKATELSLGKEISIPAYQTDLRKLTADLAPSQKNLRGLFAGGTVCDEVFYELIDDIAVTSNVAGEITSRNKFGEAFTGHCVIDFGDDEYTQGRAHPMIDSTFRSQAIIDQANDPSVALIAMDFELGFGANEDPVGSVLPHIIEAQAIAKSAQRSLIFVTYLLGTDLDYQGKKAQQKALEDAGVVVVDSVATLGEVTKSLLQSIA